MRIRREKNFVSYFNEKTGQYMRTGILKDGKDTGVDPFMTSYPELLDVGIMGHCIHGQSGLCLKSGVQCYQDGLHSNKPNMSLEDFRSIVNQSRGKVFQIALGGCGDPDQHEDFKEILKICKSNKIVPNFTTSGYGMTDNIAELCAEYCGAVAVSWYGNDYTPKAIKTLINHGVKTNIHYVVSKNSVKVAIDMLSNDSFPDGINAVIFLLHKPVGLGTMSNMITSDNKDFDKFISLAVKNNYRYKIGFDSCTVPMIINQDGIDLNSLDTCEGGRWSAYISSDMKMVPCSFDNQDLRYAVSLRDNTIKQAWNSKEFDLFRNKLRNSCSHCNHRECCMGGCPLSPDIVLCDNKEVK